MKIFPVSLTVLLAVCLCAGVAGAKPEAPRGKGVEKGNHGAVASAAAHEAKVLKTKGQARHEQERSGGVSDPGAPQANASQSRGPSMKSAEKALDKLAHARWAYNPNDTRGQGNMGNVDMLDPYGQDKDDRLALYGNRGRVIHEAPVPEPAPEEPPTPTPPPEEEPPAPTPPPEEEPPAPTPPPDWPPF